jgi:hypothetical protein
MWQIYETFTTADAANDAVEALTDEGGYQAYVQQRDDNTYVVLYCD